MADQRRQGSLPVHRSGRWPSGLPAISELRRQASALLLLVTESPELGALEHENGKELTAIDNPPARPAPHPICLLIPSADDDQLQDLTDDIRAHGLIDPIVLFEGMILDGRTRAAACERAGIAPRYARFEGGREDALILVISHNLKRRHLTKQAIADALVAAEDFNLHYALAQPADAAKAAAMGPGTQPVIKITEPKTASSRKLASARRRRQPCHDHRNAQGQREG
jgi:ParB-like chromosome segregation protein Spo0J